MLLPFPKSFSFCFANARASLTVFPRAKGLFAILFSLHEYFGIPVVFHAKHFFFFDGGVSFKENTTAKEV